MSKSTSAPKKQISEKADVNTDEKEEIFKKIRLVFSEYIPPLTTIIDTESRFELVSKKQVEFQGKKREAMYFGAVMIHSGFVGFYLMHVYINPAVLEKIGTELHKTLKGKSCFHIKKLDKNLLQQIEEAVKNGIDCYKKMKFI